MSGPGAARGVGAYKYPGDLHAHQLSPGHCVHWDLCGDIQWALAAFLQDHGGDGPWGHWGPERGRLVSLSGHHQERWDFFAVWRIQINTYISDPALSYT